MSEKKDPKDTCVLVTGGAGFIGSHTVVELLQNGYQVVIVDDLSNASEKVLDRIDTIDILLPCRRQRPRRPRVHL